MKYLILFCALTITVSAQTRDSLAQTQIPAKQCVVTFNYGGTVVRDTLSPDDVASWIGVRGKAENDTTRPIQAALKSFLRTEIDRCKLVWFAQRDLALGAVDARDDMTLGEYRAARTAVRVRYRSWLFDVYIKVPVMETQR